MRIAVLAVLIALPVAASAQSAKDLATLAWPLGVPGSVITAPRQHAAAGDATGRDLARLTWPLGAPPNHGVAPAKGHVYAGAFTAADLARLNGKLDETATHGAPLFAASESPVLARARRN